MAAARSRRRPSKCCCGRRSSHPPIRRSAVTWCSRYLMAGKVDDALKQARALQAAAPKSATGYLLEGDIYATTKQWAPAERAYREALKADPASELGALKLHGVLLAERQEGRGRCARRASGSPIIRTTRRTACTWPSRRCASRDFKTAVTHYQAVVTQQPENVVGVEQSGLGRRPAGRSQGARATRSARSRSLRTAPWCSIPSACCWFPPAMRTRALEYLARAVALAPDRQRYPAELREGADEGRASRAMRARS